MKTTKEAIAYHEAGHAYSFYLANRRFKYVTIKSRKGNGGRVVFKKTYIHSFSLHDFGHFDFFNRAFKDAFTRGSGFVSEKIYTGRNNHFGSQNDFIEAVRTMSSLPEKLFKIYVKFLAEYTFAVFQEEKNWSIIKSIAEALIEKETLRYNDIINILHPKL